MKNKRLLQVFVANVSVEQTCSLTEQWANTERNLEKVWNTFKLRIFKNVMKVRWLLDKVPNSLPRQYQAKSREC